MAVISAMPVTPIRLCSLWNVWRAKEGINDNRGKVTREKAVDFLVVVVNELEALVVWTQLMSAQVRIREGAGEE